MTRYGEGPSVKLTLWLTGDRNAQGVDGEGADGEDGENDFEEHDDRDCREKEQMIAAPGLRFWRWKRRFGVGCTAAEEVGRTPRLLYRFLGSVDGKFRSITYGAGTNAPRPDTFHL